MQISIRTAQTDIAWTKVFVLFFLHILELFISLLIVIVAEVRKKNPIEVFTFNFLRANEGKYLFDIFIGHLHFSD